MPHIITNKTSPQNVEAEPVKVMASEELDEIVRAELNEQEIKNIEELFNGAKEFQTGITPSTEAFGTSITPHVICGKPYSECCKKENQ